MAIRLRSRAVAALSRDDEIEPARIIPLPAWLGLIVAMLVLLGGFIWLLAGEVRVTVQGPGVVVSSPVNTQVASPVDGTIVQSPPRAGVDVADGEVLVRIQPLGGGEVVEVRAESAATVVGLGWGEGAQVTEGDYLLTMSPTQAPLRSYLYVAADSAVAVAAGDEVHLLPTAADPQENGFLVGEVAEVGRVPATAARMTYTTGNAQEAALIGGQGPVIEVQVRLIPDPAAPSGYLWTMPPGPGQPVASGSLTTGSIIVDRVRPYRAFFPDVRS